MKTKYLKCPTAQLYDEFMSDTNNFHQFKKLISRTSNHNKGQMLITFSSKGVHRNVKYILDKNFRGDEINEAFCEAIRNCHLDIMDLLIDKGANINYQHNLPIIIAVESGYKEVVKYLLDRGCDIQDNDLVIKCCQSGDYPDVLKMLLDNGIEMSNYHKAYDTCLEKNHYLSAMELTKYNYNNYSKTEDSTDEDIFDNASYMSEDDFSEKDE